MPETMTGREKLARLKSGHIPLVQALFDEAYACGHKDGRADAEEVATMLEAQRATVRLEWVSTGDGSARLCLRLDQFTQCLFFVLRWGSGRLSVYDFHQGLDENEVLRELDLTAVVAFIAGWHATNLPNYPLPDFPGTL